MDLSVSPDLDAYFCYAFVFVLGAIAAYSQVSKRLGSIAGIWLVPRTWLLFSMYVAVPVVLFWLLDRTGAITDTSVFAAVLVGIGYERIIAGGAAGAAGAAGAGPGGAPALRAPGEVSQFWTPFLAYADRVERLVRERTQARQQRLVDRIIAEIVQDPPRLTALQNLAMRFAPDVAALQQQLAAIDANVGALGANGVLEHKIRLLYGFLAAVPNAHELMKDNNIISARLYWRQIKRIHVILALAAVAVVVVIIAIFAAASARVELTKGWASYYVWRLGKINSTNVDQDRSRQKLVKLMRNQQINDTAVRELTSLLRRPALPIERIELVLQTLLEGRAVTAKSDIAPLLAQSLRGGSVDARVRINEVLKLLARPCEPPFVKTDPWDPAKGDSTTALEYRIGQWAAYWAKPVPCPPPNGAAPRASPAPEPARP